MFLFLQNPYSSKFSVWTISRPFKSICSNFCTQWYPQWKSKLFFYIRSFLKWTNRSKNGHSGAIKTNRFQSGFRDLKKNKKNRTNSKQEKIRIPCCPFSLVKFEAIKWNTPLYGLFASVGSTILVKFKLSMTLQVPIGSNPVACNSKTSKAKLVLKPKNNQKSLQINRIPYPCSHFYVDINFGDRFYSKEKRRGSPLLFWI